MMCQTFCILLTTPSGVFDHHRNRLRDWLLTREEARDCPVSNMLSSFHCGHCIKKFKSEAGREQHTETVHPFNFRCTVCERIFRSEKALNQHSSVLNHVPSFPCRVCSRVFKTERSLDQHSYSLHRPHCNIRSSFFKSKRSLEQHERDKHGLSQVSAVDEEVDDDDGPWRPDPPVDTEGIWVLRDNFRGTKSFGFFKCRGEVCSKTWLSAHAFAKYKQGCQVCETESRPKFLWQNLERKNRDNFDDVQDDEGPPHDQGRCEACRVGVCRILRR